MNRLRFTPSSCARKFGAPFIGAVAKLQDIMQLTNSPAAQPRSAGGGRGFGADNNAITLLSRDGSRTEFALQSKEALAESLLKFVLENKG